MTLFGAVRPRHQRNPRLCPAFRGAAKLEIVKQSDPIITWEMIHKEITNDIIGASMEVLNELRPGLEEKLYERALILELQSEAIASISKKSSRSITRVSI